MFDGKKRTVKFDQNGVTYDNGAKASIAECMRACDSWNTPHSSDGPSEVLARSFYLGLRKAIIEAGLAK